jgi:fructose/tagatose bisphosphate aldolase
MLFGSSEELVSFCEGIVRQDGDAVVVEDAAAVRDAWIDRMVYNAVFNADEACRDQCRWLIRTVGQELGITLASIQDLYMAKGRGEYENVCVPAINIRGITVDTSRAIFRAMAALNVGPVLFEIARSEIDYTLQRPAEYGASVMAAAIKEDYVGPLFLQGDHFQLNAKKFADDAATETAVVKDLIAEAIAAGFYNIDVDTSTLVDLSKDTLAEQQRANYENCAVLTQHIRDLEPEEVTVSVGGEIGEVGKQNSTPEELRAYADGLAAILGDVPSISKVSVQTGTSHGGVPMPDGSVAAVALDFDVLAACSKAANEYGMSGSVQHGASTLPDEAFNRFTSCDAAEVHLATGFQNQLYDGGHCPPELLAATHKWIEDNCAGERKEGQTYEQWIYKTRKKGFGPLKRQWWDLPQATRDAMAAQLQAKFEFLFDQLGMRDTTELMDEYVKPVRIDVEAP